ncbi:DUF2637 domain-containing protein [Brevibacterium casei]|uniref:DUF2637 domain-containing protein n=1 Tax=Brevibacterium casei TaxID=33889 RepID=A0A7T2WNE4_9MICO|nr:DUF2637 domain-containing protein [Brevibacterium casei]QPS33567.1 DUF2637 domain-containing protein [Brevibacterium casei]
MLGTQRWGWAVVTAAGGTVAIGVGAFWLSFIALADLATRSGIAGEQSWVWPLLVDGLIVVATIAVVALDGHARTGYPWTLLVTGAGISVVANATHALVAADPTVPRLLAAAVASVPPLVLVASTHLTVVLVRSAHDRHGATVDPEMRDAHLRTQHATVTAEANRSQAIPQETAPSEPSSRAQSVPAPMSRITGLSLVELAAPDNAAPADVPASPGEPGPTAEGAPTDARTRRAEAARLQAEGWSNRKIAAHMQVHPSTIGRWLARSEPSTTTTDLE